MPYEARHTLKCRRNVLWRNSGLTGVSPYKARIVPTAFGLIQCTCFVFEKWCYVPNTQLLAKQHYLLKHAINMNMCMCMCVYTQCIGYTYTLRLYKQMPPNAAPSQQTGQLASSNSNSQVMWTGSHLAANYTHHYACIIHQFVFNPMHAAFLRGWAVFHQGRSHICYKPPLHPLTCT